MDENVDPFYQIQLLRQEPDLVVWAVGDEGAPPKGTLDPEIIIWCEEHGFILVTNKTHLRDYIPPSRASGLFLNERRVLTAYCTQYRSAIV